MLRIGVIGYGYWGPNIVRNFIELGDADVVAVADIDDARLSAAKRLYPGIDVYGSGEELLNEANIDAVGIVTPVTSHFALARRALTNGVDVLVSKPMTRTRKEAEELIALAESNGCVLMVDHTFVYTGAVRYIEEAIESGYLGDVLYFDSVRVNLGLVQSDVNVVWDLAAHDFSILDFALKRMPERIQAIGADPLGLDPSLECLAYLTLQYPDGVIGHVHVNWLSPVKIRRTLIGGSKRMVVYDHLDPDHQVKVYDKGVELKTVQEMRDLLVQYRVGDMQAPKIDQTEALRVEAKHFIDCCLDRTKPVTDGEAGLRVVRMLEMSDEAMHREKWGAGV